MLKWIRSIHGRQKDMELKSSQTNKNDLKSSQHSQSDSNTSNLVLEYSKNKKLTETQLMDIRTRFNTWEKDGREVDFQEIIMCENPDCTCDPCECEDCKPGCEECGC